MLKTGEDGEVNPLIDLIRAPGYNGGPVIASFEQKRQAALLRDYLKQSSSTCFYYLQKQTFMQSFVWGIPQVQQNYWRRFSEY